MPVELMNSADSEAGSNVDYPGLSREGRQKGTLQPSGLHSAMRFVFKHPEADDRSEEHRNCRLLLKEDRSRFIHRLDEMEKGWRIANDRSVTEAAKREQSKNDDSEVAADLDDGEKRVRELIGEVRAELERRAKK